MKTSVTCLSEESVMRYFCYLYYISVSYCTLQYKNIHSLMTVSCILVFSVSSGLKNKNFLAVLAGNQEIEL